MIWHVLFLSDSRIEVGSTAGHQNDFIVDLEILTGLYVVGSEHRDTPSDISRSD